MTVHTVDAIVVGAGHNGLVAANLLADAGWDVLLLEAADEPGGAVRSAETVRPGFVTDLCSAFYPLGGASPVLAGLDLGEHGLRWRHAPLVLAHVLPDGRCVALCRDADETAASVARFAPEDAAGWLAECRRWDAIGDKLLGALFRPFPPVRAGAGLFAALGVADALRFARFALLPVRRYGEEAFKGEGAPILLAGSAMHTDIGPENAGSAIFGWLLAMLGQHVGFPVPEGGAGRITAALVARLAAGGGRVECKREVDEVLVARGRAVGVRIADGELIRARQAVLADVPAPSLYLDLIGEQHLPARLVADLANFQWDTAIVKIDWALSGPVPWTAEEARRAGTIHFGVDLDGLTEYGAAIARRTVPHDPLVLAGQMSTADPTRSPAGTETLWAYTHVPRTPPLDAGAAQRHADRVQQLIERHAPGFGELVLARAVEGPSDVAADNPSVPQGSANQGTASIHQQLIFRPVPGLGRADTPIDRLYLAGASAHPGGGVHGGPGANAARAALARAGLGGDAYRAAVRAAHRLVYN